MLLLKKLTLDHKFSILCCDVSDEWRLFDKFNLILNGQHLILDERLKVFSHSI